MNNIKKILFYGQGNGRDHVNHIEMMKSNDIEFCSIITNRNALMEQYNNVYYIQSIDETIKFAKIYKPDLVVISNRKDLDSGLTEIFKKSGFRVMGISKEVAKLETDKEYAKQFMARNNLPTPKCWIAETKKDAIDYIKSNWNKNGFVLKITHSSKNSFKRTSIPESIEEAVIEINRLFNATPNAKLIIEEKIEGYELSLHILINKGKYCILPLVQDYKKKYNNNEGPMTAGMASVALCKEIPKELLDKLKKDIIEPTIDAFKKEKIEYNYVLYIGIMISDDNKPYILEYNTRTGNPEWIAILGLLDKPFINLISAFYNNISEIENYWKKEYYSVVIYGLSNGYPEIERNNFSEIIMNLDNIKKDTDIIGEHIIKINNKLHPDGGRVFALRRIGMDFNKVKNEILEDFYKVKMNGLYFRDDIKELKL